MIGKSNVVVLTLKNAIKASIRSFSGVIGIYQTIGQHRSSSILWHLKGEKGRNRATLGDGAPLTNSWLT